MRMIGLALLALPLAACGAWGNDERGGDAAAASGSGGARAFQVADFDEVALRGHDDVIVRVGPAFSVRAEGPSEELDKLEIRKDGSTLKIGRVGQKNGFNWGGDSSKGVRVTVTMPAIRGAASAGSGDMTIDRVSGDEFEVSLAGSGDMTLGQIATRSAEFSLAGSGSIAAKGQVGKLEVSIAGSGDIDAPELRAIMGSGDVDLGSGAKCETSKMGSGSIRCGS
jgi:Putative auto-transporter adhesin, head GIN domain